LSVFDDDLKVLSAYEWNSASDTGTEFKMPMQSYQLYNPSYTSLTDYMPSKLNLVYKIFDDTTINGELCKVFSITRQDYLIQSDEPPPTGGKPPEHIVDVTEYYYISTVSGLCVVNSVWHKY